MTAALTEFNKTAESIRLFVTNIENRNSTISHVLDSGEIFSDQVTAWARSNATFKEAKGYDYASVIILLYGALERYIEEAAEEFLESAVDCYRSFLTLPDRLRNAHFTHTLSHIQRSKDSRYDGDATTEELVAALGNCLADFQGFRIIPESLLHHTANFRPAVVSEFFLRFDLENINEKIIGSKPFADYLSRNEKAVAEQKPEASLDLINLLVGRRNQIAHGDLSDILGINEMLPYCDMLEAYCRGLDEVLAADLINRIMINCGIDHGHPLDVHNKNIVCINSKGVVISVGDELAISGGGGKWQSVLIQEIQINKKPVKSSVRGIDEPIALRVTGRCKVNWIVKSGCVADAAEIGRIRKEFREEAAKLEAPHQPDIGPL